MDFFHEHGLNSVPFYGVYSATVPGTVDGWSRLQKRFGRMSLAQVLQPSIEAARQGFGLTERIRGDWESYDGFYVDMLKKDPESRKVFLRDGHVPALYSNLPQSGPGPGLRAPGQGWAGRVLPRPDRARHRATA